MIRDISSFSSGTTTVYTARDQESLRGSRLLTVQCPALLFDEIKSAAVASTREFLKEPRRYRYVPRVSEVRGCRYPGGTPQ